jgi:uncharacterized protein YndB with AHSA1/START domain
MSEYEKSRTIPALPEQVFDAACDLRNLHRWLPPELHVQVEDPPAVTVTRDDRAEKERALVSPRPDQLRLEWGTRDDSHYAGWLQVAGTDSPLSEVTVHLSFFDPDQAPPAPQVEQALDQGLERLAEQVAHRVGTAG